MAKVVLNHIRKSYEDAVIVKDFDLEVKDKEFMVFVGPSGCGKSTTLRMIAGLEEISGGELYIGDRQMNDVSPKDRNIAMVFQNYALYPHMSVAENMAFSLKLKHIPKAEIEQKVQKAAEILQLEQLLDRKPKALSGGQRQRVAMGRAIVRNPSVFLMDEPLSNLDAKLRVSMRTEISRLHKKLQTTMIYVTHDQIEAMTLGDRIVVMNDGIIQQVDTPMNLYDHPCNLFVAGFIGNPPMNFLKAGLVREGNKLFAQGEGFKAEVPVDYAEKLKDKEQIIFGIRPDDVHDAELLMAEKQEIAFRGKIDVVEMLGSEVLLHIVHGGQKLIACMPAGKGYKLGTEIDLVFAMDRMHAFDVASAVSLLD
jgi:multiple sugar transport system ATP-binding protein